RALDDVSRCLWPTLVARPRPPARGRPFSAAPGRAIVRYSRLPPAWAALFPCSPSTAPPASQFHAAPRRVRPPARHCWRVPRRACGQLLSRGRSLLREGSHFQPFLFERLCAVRGVFLLELPRFFARLAQLRRLRLNFPLRRSEFARQCVAACAFLVERLTMLC